MEQARTLRVTAPRRANIATWRFGRRLRRLPVYLGALLIAAYAVLPFMWLVIGSFQTEREIISVPPHWLPEALTVENYGHLFGGPATEADGRVRLPEEGRFIPSAARDYLPAMRNSLFVGVSVAAVNLVLASMAAYAFARLRFRGRKELPLAILGVRLVPDLALVIPFFLMVRTLDLLDSPLALIIMYVGATLPFSVFILTGYFETVPEELDEAALVDGCTRFQALVRVILPVALPSLVATAVFSFMTAWNEFLFALVLTKTTASVTLPVILASFTQDFNVSFAFMNAAAVVSVVPPVVLAVLFRRYLAEGLAMGAVKG